MSLHKIIFSRLFRSTKVILYLLYSVSLTPLRLHLNTLAWCYLTQNVFPTECSSTVKHQSSRVWLFVNKKLTFFHRIAPENSRILVHYALILLKVCFPLLHVFRHLCFYLLTQAHSVTMFPENARDPARFDVMFVTAVCVLFLINTIAVLVLTVRDSSFHRKPPSWPQP